MPVGPDWRANMPDVISFALPASQAVHWLFSFTSPTPEGAEYLGRNHRFVVALAQFLMEEAMEKQGGAKAARCGVIRTRAVSRLSTIMLLRVRYLLEPPGRPTLLAEEVVVTGATHGSRGGKVDWLSNDEALRLLAEARPDANMPMAEKRELIDAALDRWPTLEAGDSPPDRGTRQGTREEPQARPQGRRARAFVDSPSPRNSRPTCSGSSCCNRWSDHVALSVGSNRRGTARAGPARPALRG